MTQRACVLLKAGWGDGSKEVVIGEVSVEERAYLRAIGDGLPELMELISTVHGKPEVGFDLVSYVKWWILGGDDELEKEAEEMSAEEFVRFARQNAREADRWCRICF